MIFLVKENDIFFSKVFANFYFIFKKMLVLFLSEQVLKLCNRSQEDKPYL